MPVRTLKSINLPERECMELGILLSLLGPRDGVEWELTEKRHADVAIVDADADAASDAMEEARRVASIVITISDADSEKSEPHIARPLRTKILTELLAGVEREIGGAVPRDQVTVAWRLKRWPDADTLRREWRLTRVCGTLARGPQTAPGIAARTGMEEAEIEQFLRSLSDAGCAEPTEAAVRISQSSPNPPPRGLFGRLRARFGRASA